MKGGAAGEGSLYRACVTGDFAPLLNTTRRGEKANMANTGPHWLESCTLPLALHVIGFQERTCKLSNLGSKKLVGSFPSPGKGAYQWLTSGLPMVARVGL